MGICGAWGGIAPGALGAGGEEGPAPCIKGLADGGGMGAGPEGIPGAMAGACCGGNMSGWADKAPRTGGIGCWRLNPFGITNGCSLKAASPPPSRPAGDLP